jgi:hypothetical protein
VLPCEILLLTLLHLKACLSAGADDRNAFLMLSRAFQTQNMPTTLPNSKAAGTSAHEAHQIKQCLRLIYRVGVRSSAPSTVSRL